MPDQLISIPLTGGVDSKRDPNTGVPGWFTELENAEFRKPGALTKRRGYTTVAAYDHGPGLGTGLDSIVSAGTELLGFGKGKVLSYTTSNGWRVVGRTAQVRLDERHVFRGADNDLGTDVAVIGTRACAAWHDGKASYYAVYDTVTGATIKPPTLLGSAVATAIMSPRVIAGPSSFAVIYPSAYSSPTSTVSVAEITTSGSNLGGPVLRAGVRCADVICNGGTVVVAMGTSTGVVAYAYAYSSWGSPSATATILDFFSAGSNTCRTISVTSDGTNYTIAWSDTTTPYRLNATTFTDATLATPVRDAADMTSSFSIYKVAVQHNALTGNREVYATALDTGSQVWYTACAQNTLILSDVIPNVTLAGRPFVTSSGVSYVPVLFNNAVQPVLLIMAMIYTYSGVCSTWVVNFTTVGRAYFGEVKQALGTAGFSAPSHAHAMSATQGIFGLERATRLTTINGHVVSVYGPSSVLMTTGARPSAAVLGDTTLIASGSILYAYDGNAVVEHGFHVYPEVTSVTQGAAGNVNAGSHSYTVVYSWIDRNGRVHRSAPAEPVTVTLSSNAHAAVTFSTYTVPSERDKNSISYDVYRTAVNSTVYQKVASITGATTLGNPTYTYDDNQTDLQISANEVLYTNADRPANIAPPNARTVAVHGNRAWVLSGPRRLYYSHQLQDGEAPSFSDVLYIDIERDVVSVASMDERLIVLCEDRIYSIAGDGPTLQGTLSDYARPVQIASDVGCVNADSVVLTSQGLMFQSQRGIVLLDRSYQVQPIGAPVDGFLDGSRETLTITGAAVVADRGQVRFVSSQGRALVFDTLSGRWTTFTNYAASGCAVWSGRFVHARADGTLCLGRTASETSSAEVFRDGTTPIVMRFKLPWLALAGAALQRLKRVHVLGTWQGPHALAVTAWADQDTTPSAYVEWTEPTDVVIDYEVRAHVSKQKARSHMIEVKDVQHSGYWGAVGANEGCEISAVSLLVSGKTGVKTSDVKSVGV